MKTTVFAVIDVHQDYDYVEGAECVASFLTEEGAHTFIQFLKDKEITAWKLILAYIDEFVAKIEVPEDYEMWKAFVAKFPVGMYTSPKDFKSSLKTYLATGRSYGVEGYDPPPRARCCNNIFVVPVEVPLQGEPICG